MVPSSVSTSFETVTSTASLKVFTPGQTDDPSSTTTSLISSSEDESQDLFPTQDVDAIMEDPEFNKSFTEASNQFYSTDVNDLHNTGPFRPSSSQLPVNVKFWYGWEIHRTATHLGMTVIDVYNIIEKSCRQKNACSANPGASFEDAWNVIKTLFQRAGHPFLPPKSELEDWTTVQNRYEDVESNKVVSLTARLDWGENPSKALFDFRLNPMRLEESCRLHRKFGADRFMVVSAPLFTESQMPRNIRPPDGDQTSLHNKIMDWLATGIHHIAGRLWRVYYIEHEKYKTKKKQKPKEGQRQKLFLFAIDGLDLVPRTVGELKLPIERMHGRHQAITLEELTEWHMSFDANKSSTDLKLFSRWSIAHSKTKPTVVLEQHEFLYLPDEPGKPVMNDGCALMSLACAQAIWAAYGGVGEVPSAVQGRVGGAKGLWLVDYHNTFPDVSERGFWIQVSDSQLKIKPHPRDISDADPAQRTFEVLKHSRPCKEGHLNFQFLTILEDRRVPRAVLCEALLADTRRYSDSLIEAVGNSNPIELRSFMHKYHRSTRSDEQIALLGSFPNDRNEQINMLLDSGFKPRECNKLLKGVGELLHDYMMSYVGKLWIQLSYSTTCFCAPDPLGVLEPGEVYLGFSEKFPDPRTGVNEWCLNDIDVLVARNPAYLPSDMQKRHAVYKHELRNFKDVILFSVKGSRSTASLLSGGDYDGDTVTVIWDPAIVDPFEGKEVPQDLPSESQCGMVPLSRPLSNVFTAERPRAEAMADFLRACITFNSHPNLMGRCSVEHEKLVYKQSPPDLSSRGAVRLAALAGYLVDCNKQGYFLSDKAWHRFRRDASGDFHLPDPAYKTGEAPQMMMTEAGPVCANIIDYLKFDVATKQSIEVLSNFHQQFPESRRPDSDLVSLWKEARDQAEREKEKFNKTALKEILKSLDREVYEVGELWKRLSAKPWESESAKEERKDFPSLVNSVYEKVTGIEPLDLDHDVRRRYEEEKDQQYSHWSLLRASAIYFRFPENKNLPWLLAGRELCRIKAQKQGNTRLITEAMYHILKPNTRLTKRLLEGYPAELNVEDEDEVDEE